MSDRAKDDKGQAASEDAEEWRRRGEGQRRRSERTGCSTVIGVCPAVSAVVGIGEGNRHHPDRARAGRAM